MSHNLKSFADLPRMSRCARVMLKDSLDAFAAADPVAAREVIEKDVEIDRLYDRPFHSLLDQMSRDPPPPAAPLVCFLWQSTSNG
jgi:phosphate transport system protein